MSKGFLALWGSQLVSLLGSSITAFGISIWVFETTHSPFYMTLALFSKLMPTIYLSFFAGQVVDRFSPKKVFIWTDLGLLVVTLILGAAYLTNQMSMALLLPMLFLAGAIESVQSLAFQSSVALFNKPEFYMRSQGVVTLVENAPLLISPFLGAIAYEHMGLGGIFAFDIISFIVALAVAVVLRFPSQTLATRRPWFSLDAARFIWSHPLLSRLQGFFAISNFFNGLMGGLLAAYILANTGSDKTALASVNTAMAVGSVAGSLFLLIGKLRGSMVIWITVGTCVAALTGRIGLAVASSVLMWSILMAVRSFLAPVISGANQTLWLGAVERERMGSVFGMRRVFGQGLYPIAVFIGGVLSKSFALPTLFASVGGLELLVGVVGFLLLHRAIINPAAAK